ncbi:MAG TPA: hypothetical protein VK581_15325, partial [Chthoniobacterales bacterium]|nr:hypothetical protein [Chthoniobacterales bacterium]
MKKRIARIATLSLTVLFTAVSISFAQKPTPAAVNPNPVSTTTSPPAAATTSTTSTALSSQPS